MMNLRDLFGARVCARTSRERHEGEKGTYRVRGLLGFAGSPGWDEGCGRLGRRVGDRWVGLEGPRRGVHLLGEERS
mgnify:FL=1